MNTPTEKQIGDTTFIITKFMAYESLRIQRELASILGPSVGRIIGSLGKTNDPLDSKINGSELSGAITEIFSQLTEDRFFNIIGKLLRGTQAKISTSGKAKLIDFSGNLKDTINIVFDNDAMGIYTLIFAVIEVNFSPFLDKIKSSLVGLKISL